MWRIEGAVATWQDDAVQLAVALERPEQGIGNIVFQGRSLSEVTLLQMHVSAALATATSLRLEDVYARDNDLVASYVDQNGCVRPQFYWSVKRDKADAEDSILLESLVSTQTELLRSDPSIAVGCRLMTDSCHVLSSPASSDNQCHEYKATEKAVRIDVGPQGCVICSGRLADSKTTFAQVVPGADVISVTLQSDGDSKCIDTRINLFDGSVEKGVVRRAQLVGILTLAAEADEVIARVWDQLLTAPPPLAT